MTIIEFCDLHHACAPGRDWALATGLTEMLDLWARDDIKPEWRVWIASRKGVMTRQDTAHWLARILRDIEPRLTDPRSRAVIPLIDRVAAGELHDQAEIESATAAACAAADWAAAMSAAWAAAWAGAACAAAGAAADWAAAMSAAWAAATYGEDQDKALARYAEWLREYNVSL